MPTRVRRQGAIALWMLSLLLLTVGTSAPANAELRALLVGVSSYPSLPARHQLLGPRNDVQRMREVLLQRGFEAANIRTLADGVAGAGLPTRANILAALEAQAVAARPGDTLFVHFAGHGSRQPAKTRDPGGREQAGGLEAIFLPTDIGSWDGGARTVVNAITATELRAVIDRITGRGAFVWGVFDACHSATTVRGAAGDVGADDEVRFRHVEPAELGVRPGDSTDDATPTVATRGGAATRPGALDTARIATAPGRGGSVFFYAAQTDELTPELKLPAGDARRQPYGLFGFVVARAIERGSAVSYRQLAQYVLAEYGAIIEARVTPLFSGDALDEPVLGQRSAPLRQWPLLQEHGAAVGVGSLAGVAVGALFAAVSSPLDLDADAIGHLQAVNVEPGRTTLVPVAHAGRPASPATALKPGTYLRLVSNPPAFQLRVAFDSRACAADCPYDAAVQWLRKQGVPGVDVQWVDVAAAADIVLRVHRQRLLLLAPTQQSDNPLALASAPGIGHSDSGRALSPSALAARLAGELHLLARSRNLLRLAAAFAAEGATGGLSLRLQRAASTAEPAFVIAPEQVPRLRGGDRLTLLVSNGGALAQDVTVLYLDADHGITTLFPTRQGESNRVEAGGRQTIDDILIAAPPAGIERLLLIATPARRHGERADFSFLQQPSLARQRGDASDAFEAFVDAAYADFRSRGAARPSAPTHGTTMQVFTLNVGP